MTTPCNEIRNGSHLVVHCLGRTEAMWLLVSSEAGIISTSAMLGVFIYVFRNAYRYRRRVGRWPDLRTRPFDVYLLSLFFADLVHSVSDLISFKWVSEGNVHVGNVCTLQGVLILLGANTISTSTFVITLHTFYVLIYKKGGESGTIAMILVGFCWAYILLFNIGIFAAHKDLTEWFSPTPSWCGIANNHIGYKIGGEYLWLWLALLASFAVYVPLALMTRWHVVVDPRKWWNIHFTKQEGKARRLFFAMIAYPIAYSVLVLPFSIVRWKSFHRGHANTVAEISTKSLWGLSGILDLGLFLIMRRDFLLFRDEPNADGQAPALPAEVQPVRAEAGDQGTLFPLQDTGRAPA